MSSTDQSSEFSLESGATTLRGEQIGEGSPVVLLHGLSATRRYVVMGSKQLPRMGYRMIGYDARGHGESDPAPARGAYEYADLAGDLASLLDGLGLERAAIAGASMGAHTGMAFALAHPERVSALVEITPAFDGVDREGELDTWDALADGLEHGGVEGFMAAYHPSADPRWVDTVLLVTRQRLARHRHPEAVADALRVVPRSRPFESLEQLESVEVPVLVVGSRDQADPGHPLAVAQEYARRLPRGELLVEEEGKSPLAWQGGQLSHAIGDFLERYS
jgi:pimeloyl-ACP methyl ester carboxylesterase